MYCCLICSSCKDGGWLCAFVQHLLVWVEARSSLNLRHKHTASHHLRTHLQVEMMAGCVLVLGSSSCKLQQICSSNIYRVHLGRGKPRSALTQLEDRHCGRTRVERGVDSGPQSTGSTGRQGLTVDSKSTVDSGRQRSTGHTRVYAVDRVDSG